MAINWPCFLGLRKWIIFENDSLPLPLSPVMSTDISVGATCIATRTALFSIGELPMMPNRCLMLCISFSVMAILLIRFTDLSQQCRTRAVLHKHINVLALDVVFLGKDYDLVGGIPPLQEVVRPLRRAFHQNLVHLADVALVPDERMSGLQSDDLVKPPLFHVSRDIVAKSFLGGGPRTLRVHKHIRKVVLNQFHQRQRILVLFFGL